MRVMIESLVDKKVENRISKFISDFKNEINERFTKIEQDIANKPA